MANHVALAASANDALQSLPEPLRGRVFDLLEQLSDDAYVRGAKRINLDPPIWCVHVGDVRVVYHAYEDWQFVHVTVVGREPI
ncbi:MAG TPA: hypothetical protein VK324_03025 [Tepidisphaeraceae bacterium]|nr:hypothetical protein [Tepidisphaeraceae bacterium]